MTGFTQPRLWTVRMAALRRQPISVRGHVGPLAPSVGAMSIRLRSLSN